MLIWHRYHALFDGFLYIKAFYSCANFIAELLLKKLSSVLSETMSSKFSRSSRENVRVVIRYRPVNRIERSHDKDDDSKTEPMVYDEKNRNIILGQKRNKIWGFDGVCGPKVDQEAMFEMVAEQTCKDVLNGYNGTVFVYGQTGSGKTYTMYGAAAKPAAVSLMGGIPRSVS